MKERGARHGTDRAEGVPGLAGPLAGAADHQGGLRRAALWEVHPVCHLPDWLLSQGVDERQIIAINFEDIDYEHLTGYRALYDYIKGLLLPDRMNYIFLDEIQHVEQFEKAVDSLFIKDNCDVYITGSNAYFMSGELATLLSGRYVELKMLPLSFREFCSGLRSGAARPMPKI